MANANTPFGLRPVRYASGAPYNGAANIYRIPSSSAINYFIGDPVLPLGSGDGNGIPDVTIATGGASNYILGSFISIVQGGDPTVPVLQNSPVYHPSSTAQYILVADDPNLLFEVQEFGSMGSNGVMANVNLTAGAGGSTVTGQSSWQLVSTPDATATFQMRVLRLLLEADNTVGTNAKWLCRINLHSITSTTGV